jgi:hypothetical protein
MQSGPKRYLAVCAIFRDEAQDLTEWIEFHRLCGVEHFFLLDNGSTDGSQEVLRPYVSSGLVTVQPWEISFADQGQIRAYQHALDTYGPECRWLAFIDIDEFLFSPREPDLRTVLAEFEEHPGVAVHWLNYGSSGHRDRPSGLTIEEYQYRAPTQWVRNMRTKSIVDPARTPRPKNPHLFLHENGALSVNERKQGVKLRSYSRAELIGNEIARQLIRFFPKLPIDPYTRSSTSLDVVCASTLRINHYGIKSREDYETKRQRYSSAVRGMANPFGYEESRFRYHDRNDVHDPILLPYAERIREALRISAGIQTAPED